MVSKYGYDQLLGLKKRAFKKPRAGSTSLGLLIAECGLRFLFFFPVFKKHYSFSAELLPDSVLEVAVVTVGGGDESDDSLA